MGERKVCRVALKGGKQDHPAHGDVLFPLFERSLIVCVCVCFVMGVRRRMRSVWETQNSEHFITTRNMILGTPILAISPCFMHAQNLTVSFILSFMRRYIDFIVIQ
jgi:hypothetical protein